MSHPKLKKFLKYISVFVFTYLVLLPLTQNYCHSITGIDFDNQNVFFWDYLRGLGFLPYRDFFYPYGLFFFLKSQSLLWFMFYSLLAPLSLTVLYFTIIDYFFKSKFIKIVVYLTLIFIMLNLFGVQQYARYGLLLSASSLTAFLVHYYPKKSFISWFIPGLIGGLIIFISPGDGLYLIFTQFIIYVVSLFINRTISFTNIAIYILGLGIGSVPLLIILNYYHLVPHFLGYIKDFVFMSEYAKSPYLIDNYQEVLVMSTVMTGLTVLCLWLYHPKYRHRYETILLLAAFISFWVLQLKSLMRVMGTQLDFYLYVVITIILFTISLKSYKRAYSENKTLIIYLAWFVVFCISFRQPFSVIAVKTIFQAYSPRNLNITFNFPSKLCRSDNINFNNLNLPPAYLAVQTYLNSHYPLAHIASFPYDPIFYLFFKQQPPPYFTAYEASPKILQDKNIEFLRDNQISHVIYNPKAFPIDQVPSLLRATSELRYLLNHFQPIAAFNPFVILESSATPSAFFRQKNQTQYPEMYQDLLHPLWGPLPASEGKTKNSLLFENAQDKLNFNNSTEFNQYLKTNPTIASNYFLIIKYNQPKIGVATVTGQTKLGETIVSYTITPNSNHLINLNNIPLFMTGDRINTLKFSPEPEYVWLIKANDSNFLW